MRFPRALAPVLVSILALTGASSVLPTLTSDGAGRASAAQAHVQEKTDEPVPETAPVSLSRHEPDDPTHLDPAPAGVDIHKYVSTAELLRRSQGGGQPDRSTDPLGGGVSRHNSTTAGAGEPVPASEFTAAYTPGGSPVMSGLTSHTPSYCAPGGDGTSGARVQLVYAVEQGKPDRYGTSIVQTIQNEAANIDDTFAVSARKTSGGRLVRWVTDANCVPTVVKVVLPAGSLGTDFSVTRTALRNAGLTAANRKYEVFADANAICGVGSIYIDNTSANSNYNNGGNMHARIDTGCWNARSDTGSVPAHELMHMLGGVQPTYTYTASNNQVVTVQGAPHQSAAMHCTDDADLMCYSDGPGVVMTSTCPSSQEPLFDCNNDDYFNTNPQAGSYLATHWNAASNQFLQNSAPVTATASTASATTGVSFTLTGAGPSDATYVWTAPDRCTVDSPGTKTSTAWCDQGGTGAQTFGLSGTTGGNAYSTSVSINVVKSPAPSGTLVSSIASPKNGQTFTVTASVATTGTPTYTWANASNNACYTGGAGTATTSYTCPADATTRTLPLELTVRQRDGQSKVLSLTVTSTPTASAGPTASISGAGVLRAGLPATYTATSTPAGATWSWAADQASCIVGTTDTSTLSLQCPATTTGQVTLTAIATSGGLSGQAQLVVTLATDAQPLTSALSSDVPTAYVGRDITLTGTVLAGTTPVRSTVTVESTTDGTTWTPVQTGVDTGPDGAITVAVRPSLNTATTYRLRPDASAAWTVTSAVTTVSATTVQTSLVLTAPAAGTLSVQLLDGTGAPLSDRQLVLQSRVSGETSWRTLPRTYTTTVTALTVVVSPDRPTSYRFVFAGATNVAPSTSATVGF